jgi:hypothetical protein
MERRVMMICMGLTNSISWLLRLVSGVYVLLRAVGGRLGLLTNQLLCH